MCLELSIVLSVMMLLAISYTTIPVGIILLIVAVNIVCGVQHTNDFALYTEAIKFFNHSESMVRIAVRTITLNVYRGEMSFRIIVISFCICTLFHLVSYLLVLYSIGFVFLLILSCF